MAIKNLLLFGTLLSSFSLHALVGIGSYSPHMGQYQEDRQGESSTFNFNMSFTLNTIKQIRGNHYFMPQLGYVFNQVDASDDYSKRTMFILYDFGYGFGKNIYLRYGLGNFITKISGEGGTKELNNSTSTSTFYLPEETSTSYNTTLNLGLEALFKNNFSAQGEFFIFGPFSSTKRNVSMLLTINFYMK